MQHRETECKIFQTGLNRSWNDWYKRIWIILLQNQFAQTPPPHIPVRPSNKSREPRNISIFRRIPDRINANARKSRGIHAKGILQVARRQDNTSNNTWVMQLRRNAQVLNKESESRLHHRSAFVVYKIQ